MAIREKITSIGCLGITYKADVDDVRESPAIDIIKGLTRCNIGQVIVADPFISKHEDLQSIDIDSGLLQADIILILTDHSIFKAIDWSLHQNKVIIDTRGILPC